MKAQKEAALQNLITQMYEMMANGDGDEPMEEGELSESIEGAAESPKAEGSKMMEKMSMDEGEDCEVDDEEKMNFMKSKIDRPKRKSITVMAMKAKPAPKMEALKEMMSQKPKAKGKK